jgi:hypothetical protein
VTAKKYNTRVKGMEIRQEILERSIFLEYLTSSFLGRILDISDPTSSKSLGNKSSALTFMNKINLFMDLGAINSKERLKFERFMQIRNQFMHNIYADSYLTCVSQIDGLTASILKDYPQLEDSTDEDKIRMGVLELSLDVLKLTQKIMEEVDRRLEIKKEGETAKRLNEFILKVLERMEGDLGDSKR